MKNLKIYFLVVIVMSSCRNSKEEVLSIIEKARNNEVLHGALYVEHHSDTLFYGFNGKMIADGSLTNNFETKFCLASVTKLFTEVAILRLIDQEIISLDDGLNIYLEQLPEWSSEVTIEQLLNMTSGLPREMVKDSKESMVTFSANGHVNLLTDSLKTIELISEPGRKVNYSNLGYWLLGAVIEKVTDKTINDALSSLIFDELKMQRSGILLPDTVPDNLAQGLVFKNGSLVSNEEFLIEGRYASGGGFSTLHEMLILARALKSPGFLSEDSWGYLNASAISTNKDADQIVGVEVFGSLPNFTNFYIYDYANELLIIGLNNIGVKDVNDVLSLKADIFSAVGIDLPDASSRPRSIKVLPLDSLSKTNPLELELKRWIEAVLKGDQDQIFSILHNLGANEDTFKESEPDWAEIAKQKSKMVNFRAAGFRWVKDEIPNGLEVWFISDTEAKIGFLWIPSAQNPDRLEAIMVKPVDTHWMGSDF